MKVCKICGRKESEYGVLNKYKTKKGFVKKRYLINGLCGMCEKRRLHGDNYKFIRDNKTKSKFYSIWAGMKKRCYKTSCKDYKNYGAKGVEICDKWLNRDTGFRNFEAWCKDNYKDGLTIDRIDVKGNYEPENCRFITREEQNKNQRPKSNINEDYIFKLKSENSSNFRIYIGNRKSRYAKTLEIAKQIRKEYYGY